MHESRRSRRILSNDTAALWLLGLAFAALHLVAGARYGFHRDELLIYSNARDLADLTRRCFTASERKTVRRLFHEVEGCSMATYALRRRALLAFEDLLNTDDSLAEIACRGGFYDQAHFTKVFARLFGVTPGPLRSRMN